MTASTSFEAMDFYPEFQCIGSECEFNCCNSWSIDIDEKTHNKYKEHDRIFDTNICHEIITTSKRTEFKLKDDGNCPQLQSNGLCSIVCDIGPEALSKTCQTYPRQSRHYIERKSYLLFLSISCPEASRMAIFRQKKLETINLRNSSVLFDKNIPSVNLSGGTRQHELTINAIDRKLIDIIQLRKVSIKRRLATLIVLASIATKTNAQNNTNAAALLLEEANKTYKKNLDNIPELPENRLNQFITMIELSKTVLSTKTHSVEKGEHEAFTSLFATSFNGLGISNLNRVNKESFELYNTQYEKATKKYFDDKPYIIENLVSYHLMKDSIFFQEGLSPIDAIIKLMAYILMILGLSPGHSIQNGKIKDDDINRAIFLLHRRIEHSKGLRKNLTRKCKELSDFNIGQLYTFIA